MRWIFWGAAGLLGGSALVYLLAVATRSLLLAYVASGGVAGGLLLSAFGVLTGPMRRR